MEDLFNYKIKEDGTVSVTGFKNVLHDTRIAIPRNVSIKGINYTVTEIDDHAFNNKGITRLFLPNTIKYIGIEAFLNNEINNLIFEEGIKDLVIADYAFKKNELTKINLPEGISEIGNRAFDDNHIYKVTIPKSVIVMGKWSFKAGTKIIYSENKDTKEELLKAIKLLTELVEKM